MWPFKKKEIHNPDCYMCADPFNKPNRPATRCSRTGCSNPSDTVVFHWTKTWARYSYLCESCFKEHNWFFYGKNEYGEPEEEGFLFTPPAPDPRLVSIQTRTGTIRGCECNCP